MPITRKQFELEIDSETEERMRRIHEFLSARKEQAFSAQELYLELPGEYLREPLTEDEEDRYYESAGILDADLDKLTKLEAVERRVIRGTGYYAYKKDIPF